MARFSSLTVCRVEVRNELSKLNEKLDASPVSLVCCGSISFGWFAIELIVFRLSARLLMVFRLVVLDEGVVTSVRGRFMARDGSLVGRAGDVFDRGDVVNGEPRVVELRLVTGRLPARGPVDESDVESDVGMDVDSGVDSEVGIDKGRLTGLV